MSTVYPSTPPAGHDSLGGGANLFTRFLVSGPITIEKLLFYSPTNANNVTASLYKGTTLLALKFETLIEAGWGEFILDTPVEVDATDGLLDIGVCVPVSLHYSFVPGQEPITEGSVYQTPGNQYGSALADPAVPGSFSGSSANPSTTFFGVAFEYEGGVVPLFPLAFTVARLDNDNFRLEWDDADTSITDGVRILRSPGVVVNDVSGDAPGTNNYDPSTIPGVSTIDEDVMTSPYDDAIPSEGTYTYWLQRMP